ncbi:hypothetical protein ACSBR2_037383 [Camellia fascicularis]
MVDTAVFHLLASFAPFLQGEVNLLSGVREAMEDIRDEFQHMSAFLRVADAMEERDPELKVWVKQVRDTAYDTEYDRRRIDEWEMLYRSLGAELEGNDKLESIKKALSFSYNDLPYYLKNCFLYLSIFLEDQEIWCESVIRLWTAEGFVNAIEGKTIEEVANGYLDELFNRSLIQVAKRYPDGRPSHFHIHDLMREIIMIIDKSN